MLPFRALIAFSASASFVISTNANPRGSPVSRSTMIRTCTTCPWASNSRRSSSSVTSEPRLQTKRFFTVLIVGCSRAIGQEDEVERLASPGFRFFSALVAFDDVPQLYIDPVEYIDCRACNRSARCPRFLRWMTDPRSGSSMRNGTKAT